MPIKPMKTKSFTPSLINEPRSLTLPPLPPKPLMQISLKCPFRPIALREKDAKSSEVREFWNNSSTVTEALRKASTDFSEALANTIREIIRPEIATDADNNPLFISEHGKDSKNATNQDEKVEDELIEYAKRGEKYFEDQESEKIENQ
ncbi:8694_t:CDS:2 [Funneliformis mosseae]|uniref:8694_t:CDS:1 n=1 Tax=Funneliformis mosseae TaxID=27381 RepID=A0A9N8ZC09_FUNMO|nr:8694_t:CDS:2 [Funneliformis mosseae]